MKFRKPFRPKIRKIPPTRYRDWGNGSHNRVLLFGWQPLTMASIILMSIYLMVYTSGRFRNHVAHGIQETSHVWLVMLKATRYAAAGIEGTALGDSDFRVLEGLAAMSSMLATVSNFGKSAGVSGRPFRSRKAGLTTRAR